MAPNRIVCSVFRSPKKEGLYLYVAKPDGLSKVPDVLLERFGKPVHAMDMLLRPEKPLARVEVKSVMSAIRTQGFYLQMPPAKENHLLDLYTPGQSEL